MLAEHRLETVFLAAAPESDLPDKTLVALQTFSYGSALTTSNHNQYSLPCGLKCPIQERSPKPGKEAKKMAALRMYGFADLTVPCNTPHTYFHV